MDHTVDSAAEVSAGTQLPDPAHQALTFCLARRAVPAEASRGGAAPTPDPASSSAPTQIRDRTKTEHDYAAPGPRRASRLGHIEIPDEWGDEWKKDKTTSVGAAAKGAEPVEAPARKDKPDGHGRPWSTEAHESSIPAGRRPGNDIRGLSVASGEHEKLIFVRLGVHYELAPSAVPVTGGLSDRLMRLVVVRESCSVSLPELSAAWTAGCNDGADRVAGYIEHQLNEAALRVVRQLWRTAHRGGLALESRSVAALQKNLSNIFLGHLPELEHTDLIAEDISADAVERLIGPASRCVELVGFIDEVPGNPTVRCVGSKAMVHDEFCNIVISATTN